MREWVSAWVHARAHACVCVCVCVGWGVACFFFGCQFLASHLGPPRSYWLALPSTQVVLKPKQEWTANFILYLWVCGHTQYFWFTDSSFIHYEASVWWPALLIVCHLVNYIIFHHWHFSQEAVSHMLTHINFNICLYVCLCVSVCVCVWAKSVILMLFSFVFQWWLCVLNNI